MGTSENELPQEGLVTDAEIARIRSRWSNPQTHIDICEQHIAEVNRTVATYRLPNKYVDLLELLESHKHALQAIADGKKVPLSTQDLQFDRKMLIDNPHLENLKQIANDCLTLSKNNQQNFLHDAKIALHSVQNIAVGPLQTSRVKFIAKNMGQGALGTSNGIQPGNYR